MNQEWDGIERRKSLRAAAEAMVGSLSPNHLAAQPTEILLHELLVHKVELEMQNEELRRAHAAMEEARDHYADLYEFAPVAYITINRHGMISEINLTGAALLGVDRAKLIHQRFSTFVSDPDKDRWYRLFLNMMENPKGGQQKFGLEMKRADGMLFYGHLDCLRKETANAPQVLRVALTDITQQKAESEQVG
ncbi:PAS domain-containing protein [Methylomicrobium sp. Wu6]|uniref:PAS domain-containing protein n=1 Tax=Methylomicrobium sp. Wu6 TaxID=3107928 RepID=UPI002DD65D9E|nr:PAS domain-containing protein [Methylomicrobium sp. Wu6]MEC4747033.1 PAS domain-containing protein [Methylomicrobium sp. Wu6]